MNCKEAPELIELCTNCTKEDCPGNGCSDYNAIKRRISGRSRYHTSNPEPYPEQFEICTGETLLRVNRAIDALEALCADPGAAPFTGRGIANKLLEQLKHARFNCCNKLIDWDAVAERM